MKTSQDWANEVMEEWEQGTDIRDQIVDWMWEDLFIKLSGAFHRCAHEARNQK